MIRGSENGLVQGNTVGIGTGLHNGLSGNVMTRKLNYLNPSHIRDPKRTPVFYINGDNVTLNSGTIQLVHNLIDDVPNRLLLKVEDIFTQTAGTTYRPALTLNGLGGKNYINFADNNAYLTSSGSAQMYCAINSPLNNYVTATGFTYMFVIRRAPGVTGTVSILDGRASTTLSSVNDILIELDNSGSITFDYRGGNSGTVTGITGTAGSNLLDDWSIVTIKCQLRIDGGPIPLDGQFGAYKRYDMPRGARLGPTSPIDIFVNGVEQQKKVTTNNYTNADHFNDGSYRLLDRTVYIGNKGAVYGTAGTHIAAAVMIPTYVDKAFQQKIENYFRYYYNKPF